jgi:trigger factor
LDYQIQRGENWHHVISVSIPAEMVKPELDAKYAELKDIKIEGFRKGKVPQDLIKKMYGKQVEADAFRPFISDAYQTVFKENEFDLIESPEVHNIQFDAEKGLTFEFQFDVRPVVAVGEYKNLTVERVIFDVTDEDLNRTLETMRMQNAMVHQVEGEAQIGHFIIADMQELDVSGVPILGRKLDDRVLQLTEGDEVSMQLLGVKPGEERRIRITVADQPESQVVQTKKVEHMFYALAVKEIKERRLPDLDDEFAKDMGPFDSLEALRQEILQRLQMQAQSDSARLYRQTLEDELIKHNPVQPPPSMIENYMRAVLDDARKRQKEGWDENNMRELFKPMVIRNISWILLREQLIRDLNIAISDEDLETRMNAIAANGKAGEEHVKELRANEQSLQRLREAMEEEKVYDVLVQHAVISELHQPWRQQRTADVHEEINENEE